MGVDLKRIKKVLIFSLSNIGDVILTLPVVDIIRSHLPDADISFVHGPKAKSLFVHNQKFKKVFIYDKYAPLSQKWQWVCGWRRERYDLVIDLRNTAIPYMIGARYKTSFFSSSKFSGHMRFKHIQRLQQVHPFSVEIHGDKDYCLDISADDQSRVRQLLQSVNLENKPFVLMAPSAANPQKRWPVKEFAKVADGLMDQHQLPTVMVGALEDQAIGENILSHMKYKAINFAGDLSLIQLAELAHQSLFAFVNDSGPMHLFSYLNRPVLAIFRASDPLKYGPWSEQSHYFSEAYQMESNELKSDDHTSILAKDILECIQINNGQVQFQT